MLKTRLALFYLFYFSAIGVYVIFLPKVLHDLNYTTTQIGIIFSVAAFMRFLTPFVFLKRFTLNHKLFNYALLFLLLSIGISYITITDFYLFFITTIIYGLSLSLILPFIESIAIQKIEKEDYGKIRLFGSIGFMIVALVLSSILTSYYVALNILLLTTIASAYYGYLIGFEDTVEDSDNNICDNSFSIYSQWRLWASLLLMQMSFGAFYNFFTIYEIDHGISLVNTSYLWSFGVIMEIIMLYYQGWILKRYQLLDLIKFATLLTSVRWLLVYFYSDNLTILFFSQSLHAFSFALYHTSVIMYLFQIYTHKKLSQQFFLGIAYGLGGFIGAIIAGYLYGDYLFLSSAIFAFISYLFIIKK